jgi:hypothetical protein
MPTDTNQQQELKPSTKEIIKAKPCRPPEDIGMNHRPLPHLQDVQDTKFAITDDEALGTTRRRSR